MDDMDQRSGSHRLSVRLPAENPCREQNFVIAANSSADTENYPSTTLTASSIARLSATRFTRAGQSTPRSSLANDRHFLSEVLFGAGGLPAAPFAHFANVFRYG